MVEVVDEVELVVVGAAVVVVVGAAVVVVRLVVVVVVDAVVAVGAMVVVGRPGTGANVVVVSSGIDEEVVLDVLDVVVGKVDAVVVVVGMRFSISGVAVNSGVALMPSWAFFITSAKIWAGNEPPVTARPWTFDIGWFGVSRLLSS